MLTGQDTPIRFTGPPTALKAEVALVAPFEVAPVPALLTADARHPLALRPLAGDDLLLSLALPASTPPGALKAEVELGGKTYPAVIEVQEKPKLTVKPKALALAGRLGEELGASVEVTNTGNIALPFEAADMVNLRPASALARGIGDAFKQPGDIVTRLIRLGERLDAEPTGTLAVTWKTRIKSLAVGQTAVIEFSARVPEKIDAAVTWTGRLSMFFTTVAVTLEVAAEPKAPPARKRKGV